MTSEGIFVEPDGRRERELRERGFTTMPLLNPEEVETLRQGLFELLDRHRIALGSEAELREGHCSYSHDDADYRHDVAQLVRRVVSPAVKRVLEGYRVVAGGAFVKAPGAREMGVHLDYTATPDPDLASYTLWCPLVDVGPANGAMCMLPGSHKVRRHVMGPGVTPFFARYPKPIRRHSVPIPVPAGHALLSDTRMIHWSLPNRSGGFRPAVHCVCIPEDSPHAVHVLDGGNGKPRFRIFDLSDAETVDAVMSFPSLPSLGEHAANNPAIGWRDLKRLVAAANRAGGETRSRWRLPFLAGR